MSTTIDLESRFAYLEHQIRDPKSKLNVEGLLVSHYHFLLFMMWYVEMSLVRVGFGYCLAVCLDSTCMGINYARDTTRCYVYLPDTTTGRRHCHLYGLLDHFTTAEQKPRHLQTQM